MSEGTCTFGQWPVGHVLSFRIVAIKSLDNSTAGPIVVGEVFDDVVTVDRILGILRSPSAVLLQWSKTGDASVLPQLGKFIVPLEPVPGNN